MKSKNLKKAALDFIFSSADEKQEGTVPLDQMNYERLNGYDVAIRATALILSLPLIFGLLMLIFKAI